MKPNKLVVILTGIGVFCAPLALAALVLKASLLYALFKWAFGLTWTFMLIHVLVQKRMEASSKVGWFAGIFLFGFIVGPFYWYWHIREANKWGELAGSW